jgi:type I restriction enzyme S subunit
MREGWNAVTLDECLTTHFPGEWGGAPERGANATVLRSTDMDDDGHIDVRAGARRAIPPAKLEAKRLLPGDVLLEASGGGPNKPVGRVALFTQANSGAYICSNFFRTLRPNPRIVDASFLAWRLKALYASPAIWTLQQQTTGIINLKYRDYLQSQIGLPSLPEQRRIAEILDTLDETIRKTEQLIAKLKQLKQGLLHDMLTLSVDDNGELRDPERHPEQFTRSSLGMVPVAWTIMPIRDVVDSAVDGPFGSNLKTEHYVPEPGVRLVRLQNIGNGEFHGEDRAWISRAHARTLERHDVRPGDVLVASLGDHNHPFARACLYPTTEAVGVVKADCFRLRVGAKYFGGILAHVLNTPYWRKDVRRLAQGVTRDRVNLGNLLRVTVPVPPLTEQRQVLEVLRAAQSRLLGEQRAVAKLRLLRHGLAEDLLTGDVRVPVPTVEHAA